MMDAQPFPAGDMKDLERRLAEWQPSRAGLDTESMMFAAGRASVSRGIGRFVWPIVSGCLAVLATGLGIGLTAERSERLELTARLRDKPPVVVPTPSGVVEPSDVPSSEPPAANSYLASRRILSENFDEWMVQDKVEPSEAPQSNRPILKARSRDDQLDR